MVKWFSTPLIYNEIRNESSRNSGCAARAHTNAGCSTIIITAIPLLTACSGLPDNMMVTRRWFYLVPAQGEPVKLVHRIESHHLDSLPGSKMEYSAWQELWQNLEAMLKPYQQRGDAVLAQQPDSLHLAGRCAACWSWCAASARRSSARRTWWRALKPTLTDAQIASHFKARDAVDKITAAFFQEIGTARPQRRHARVRNAAVDHGSLRSARTWRPAIRPTSASNAHSGDPHYEPTAASPRPIKQGDFVLLDIWAKAATSPIPSITTSPGRA